MLIVRISEKSNYDRQNNICKLARYGFPKLCCQFESLGGEGTGARDLGKPRGRKSEIMKSTEVRRRRSEVSDIQITDGGRQLSGIDRIASDKIQ